MRRGYTIVAGQVPVLASIIIGQNNEITRGRSMLCSGVASDLCGTTRTQYESVAAIHDLRG